MCEVYAGIYNGFILPSETEQLKEKLESALPELYAAVIVFAVKAKSYFEAKCMYLLLLNHLLILN